MTFPVLPGAQPRAHVGRGPVGLLIVHGFTGTPASMAPIADRALAADLPFEQPLLPGHGTDVSDMLATRWPDWVAATLEAFDRLSERVSRIVVVGQSMGATLALAVAHQRDVAGLALINPLVVPRTDDEIEMIDDLLEGGFEVAPGEGSDIADPDSSDLGYEGTPLAPIRSLLVDGVAELAPRHGELHAPLLLFTSRNDHVVDPGNSVHLAARYGGSVDQYWLERSFHVAAIDYDRDTIADHTIRFASALAEETP